jgi:hypothetical protein
MNLRRTWCALIAFPLLLLCLSVPIGAQLSGASGAAEKIASIAGRLDTQTPQPTEETLLSTLPLNLQEAGAAILRAKDDDAKSQQLDTLLQQAGLTFGSPVPAQVRPFLVGLVDAKQCPRHSLPCINLLSRTLAKVSDPMVKAALERWAASNPDPETRAVAVDRLFRASGHELLQALEERVNRAWASGDWAEVRRLGRLQERWGPLEFGATMPLFFWDPPPLFSVKPASDPIRVLAIGDFGTGSPTQQTVAATMLRYHHEHPFDFGITLGDNYQDDGAYTPTDPRWQKYWEQFYPQLGIPFYVSPGNHDWIYSADSAAAEILYQKSPQWRLPAPYYTFIAGPVQFFAVNTVFMSGAQLLWLQEGLQKSTAKWKIVYGHYQIYSAVRGDNPELIKRLFPILEQNHVDAYLCGHEHLFQHLRPEGGVHFFVSGSSGLEGEVPKPYDRLLFTAKEKQAGFTVLEADNKTLTVKFIDAGGKQIYDYTLRK